MTHASTLFYVYEHWRPDKDICFYVGKGKDDRAYYFNRTYNRRYNSIVRKLAKLGLCVEVRIVKGGLSEIDAFILEIERIAFWRSINVMLTNKTNGGDGASGRRYSQKTLQKMSQSQKGRRKSSEHRAKLSAANMGKTHSLETRQKMSEQRIGNTWGRGGKGLRRSEETKRRMSIAQKGHSISDETRAKISATLKSRFTLLKTT